MATEIRLGECRVLDRVTQGQKEPGKSLEEGLVVLAAWSVQGGFWLQTRDVSVLRKDLLP